MLLSEQIEQIEQYLISKPISVDYPNPEENPFQLKMKSLKGNFAEFCDLTFNPDFNSDQVYFNNIQLNTSVNESSARLRKAKNDNGKPSKKYKTDKRQKKPERSPAEAPTNSSMMPSTSYCGRSPEQPKKVAEHSVINPLNASFSELTSNLGKI
jgi:hypothetical protein